MCDNPFAGFEDMFRLRIAEADDYYDSIQPKELDAGKRGVAWLANGSAHGAWGNWSLDVCNRALL